MVGARRTALATAVGHIGGGSPRDNEKARTKTHAAHAFDGGLTAHAVIHNVYALAIGQRLHLVAKATHAGFTRWRRGVEHMVSTLGLDDGELFIRAPGGNHRGAQKFRHLHGGQANGPRRAMDQYRLTRL